MIGIGTVLSLASGGIPFLVKNIGTVFVAVGAAAVTFFAVGIWDNLVDDPHVRREATKEYVKLAELKRTEAELKIANELLVLERETNDRLQKEVEAYEQAARDFGERQIAAEIEKQNLEDEIRELQLTRQGAVPTLGDTNLIDRLRVD